MESILNRTKKEQKQDIDFDKQGLLVRAISGDKVVYVITLGEDGGMCPEFSGVCIYADNEDYYHANIHKWNKEKFELVPFGEEITITFKNK